MSNTCVTVFINKNPAVHFHCLFMLVHTALTSVKKYNLWFQY